MSGRGIWESGLAGDEIHFVSYPPKHHNCLPSIAYLGFLGQHGLHTVLLLWAAAVSLLSLLTVSFGDKEILRDLGREPTITLPHLLKARNFPPKKSQ